MKYTFLKQIPVNTYVKRTKNATQKRKQDPNKDGEMITESDVLECIRQI